MVETTRRIEAEKGLSLFARRWTVDAGSFPQPRAVVQISHGMGEHSLRYAYTAARLCAAGFEVWASDHRGHGETARGGRLGHVADKDGFFTAVNDLVRWSDVIASERPRTPLFLLGHSWGSFLAQAYIERYGDRLAGCALSGTRGPGGARVVAGAVLGTVIAGLFGPRRYSRLLDKMAGGNLNVPFEPARTPFDWLSRNEKTVDAYIADPLCGFHQSAGFFRDLAAGLADIHNPRSLALIPKRLPIYVFSGSRDPVGEMGKSPSALVDAYRALGVEDLEFVLYPDARHETLNEINRDEVIGALVSWLERHQKPGTSAA